MLPVKTRIAIIGGFLGAGKTTLATKIATQLQKMDKSVAIITNDQGEALVDTQYSKSLGFDVSEVLRGCFCCRFPDFLRSARTLVSSARPDIILAEPVGSCTDLLATVIAPLKAIYPNEFEVAPLMILVDSTRLLSDIIDSATPGDYLRRHQIEEGEVIVLSKTDMVPKERVRELEDIIRKINPKARIVSYSSISGTGLGKLIDNVSSNEVSTSHPVEIDYDIYAAAEAELGWYNGSFKLTLPDKTDAYDMAMRVLRSISDEYEADDIAHVKLMLTSEINALKMSLVCQSVNVDGVKGSRYGEGPSILTVNARVVSSPEKLKDVVRKAVANSLECFGLRIDGFEDDSFSPSRPQPTHKMG
jgi:G3E family GTPase